MLIILNSELEVMFQTKKIDEIKYIDDETDMPLTNFARDGINRTK